MEIYTAKQDLCNYSAADLNVLARYLGIPTTGNNNDDLCWQIAIKLHGNKARMVPAEFVEAMINNDLDTMEKLSDQITDWDETPYPWPQQGMSKTLLQIAAETSNKDVVHYLLSKGADVNKIAGIGHLSDSLPPMYGAVYYERPAEIVQLLLDAGARIDDVFQGGATALSWAVRQNNVEAAKVLLKEGANVLSFAPIHNAIRNNNEELVRLLDEAGAERVEGEGGPRLAEHKKKMAERQEFEKALGDLPNFIFTTQGKKTKSAKKRV